MITHEALVAGIVLVPHVPLEILETVRCARFGHHMPVEVGCGDAACHPCVADIMHGHAEVVEVALEKRRGHARADIGRVADHRRESLRYLDARGEGEDIVGLAVERPVELHHGTVAVIIVAACKLDAQSRRDTAPDHHVGLHDRHARGRRRGAGLRQGPGDAPAIKRYGEGLAGRGKRVPRGIEPGWRYQFAPGHREWNNPGMYRERAKMGAGKNRVVFHGFGLSGFYN